MTQRIPLGHGREFDFIESLHAGENPDVIVGIGDDCAVLANGIAISVDTSVDGVHFRRGWLSLQEIGYRSTVAAMSDLAAMAADPIAVFAALSLADDIDQQGAREIMAGVHAAAHELGVALAGGDTTRSAGPLSLSITAVGRTASPVLRAGARAGDAIYVTGRLGAAAAAVAGWEAGGAVAPEQRIAFVRPRARVAEARWLNERAGLHALIDISDGLLGDARHIAAASNVRLELEAELVPRANAATIELANRGDDYELLFTADAGAIDPLIEEFERTFGTELTRVGAVRTGAGAVLLSIDGAPIDIDSYDHLAHGSNA